MIPFSGGQYIEPLLQFKPLHSLSPLDSCAEHRTLMSAVLEYTNQPLDGIMKVQKGDTLQLL